MHWEAWRDDPRLSRSGFVARVFLAPFVLGLPCYLKPRVGSFEGSHYPVLWPPADVKRYRRRAWFEIEGLSSGMRPCDAYRKAIVGFGLGPHFPSVGFLYYLPHEGYVRERYDALISNGIRVSSVRFCSSVSSTGTAACGSGFVSVLCSKTFILHLSRDRWTIGIHYCLTADVADLRSREKPSSPSR